MEKLLSIIIPSYNMERYLPKCLDSLIVDDTALFQKLDVIVVNDGSKDRTSAIAHEYEAKYPGVFRVIDKPNGNYGSCVNAGLKVYSGRYVRVLDADDYVDNELFSDMLCALGDEASKVDGCDLFLTDYEHVDEDGVVTPGLKWNLPGMHFNLSDVRLDQYRFLLHSITYKRTIFDGWNYQQTEGVSYTDLEWVLYPMSRVKTVCYFAKPVAKYLIGRAGQTMDAKVYVKSYKMLVVIMRNLCAKYVKLISSCSEESIDYIKHHIAEWLKEIYYAYIFGFKGEKVSADLVSADKYMGKVSPALHTLVGSFTINSSRFPIAYVSSWRRWRSRYAPGLIFARLYIRVCKLINGTTT